MAMSKPLEYELTLEEHNEMCRYIERGFRDSLRKFLENVSTKNQTCEGEPMILSPKTFNPDPTSTRVAPLVMAAMEGRIGILQLFLEVFKDVIDINHGSYIVYPDLEHFTHKQVIGYKSRELTAVNAACVGGFTEMVKSLVQLGADLNKPDYFGNTPLCNAARYGRADTVEYLLKKGTNSLTKTHAGYTAVHLAAMHGQTEVIKVMMSKMIDLHYPKANGDTQGIPCPLYLAAEHGWQPVVELFTEHLTCPKFCKIDAQLLLGAASRMFWTHINPDSMKSVIDIWIEARKLKDTRKVQEEAVAYNERKELISEKDLKILLEHPNVEEESLYQCLIIHERCLGSSNSYNWVSLAGMKMFQRQHYKEAEKLWKRAMELHYEIAKQNIGQQYWQHDLKGTVEYMIQFGMAIETMVKNGYQPMWEEYVDYALQQLKMGILTSLRTNILDSSTGILKVYYCLLQIFSCWIVTECGSYDVTNGFKNTNDYSESLYRAGQAFVDTASVLTQSNLLHLAIYPATGLKIRWQTAKRLPGLIKALIDWGAITAVNDVDFHGNRPLHIAAKLPNKAIREPIVAVLLQNEAHLDALNKDGKTAEEVYKLSYPQESSEFLLEVPPKLTCLCARIICQNNISYDSRKLTAQLNTVIRLHSLTHTKTLSTQQWITLPQF